MKRFYCTICKRVKRVRKYPVNVQQVTSEDVMMRQGSCTWHTLRTTANHRDMTTKVGR